MPPSGLLEFFVTYAVAVTTFSTIENDSPHHAATVVLFFPFPSKSQTLYRPQRTNKR